MPGRVPDIPEDLMPLYRTRLRALRKKGVPYQEARQQAIIEAKRVWSGAAGLTDQEWKEKLARHDTSVWLDMVWVYSNVSMEEPDMPSCPSPGALGLLKWAQDGHQKEFYTEYFRMAGKRTGDDEEANAKEDARRTIGEIESMLDALLQQGAEDILRELAVS